MSKEVYEREIAYWTADIEASKERIKLNKEQIKIAKRAIKKNMEKLK